MTRPERQRLPLPGASRPPPPPFEMTRRCDVNGPRTGRFPPAHGSSSAAPPASSLAVRLPSAAAPPFMPTTAGGSSLTAAPGIHCTVGNESCLPCLPTTSNGQKKPEMGRMLGVAVDGYGSNEENEEGSNSCSIGPSTTDERSSNPDLEDEVMSMDTKDRQVEVKIKEVLQKARECGATESTGLWLGVLEIILSERAIKFFMGSDQAGRMAIIKHYAHLHECHNLGGSKPCDIQSKMTVLKNKPEMGRMLGVAVDGYGSNKEKEEGYHPTPLSISGGSNSCSTGSSTDERSSSPDLEDDVTSMDTKERQLAMKIKEVQRRARECGATESTPDLWIGVLEIIHSERATKFFMESDPAGRMAIIKHYGHLHECQNLGGSKPCDIQSKMTVLKRDTKPVEAWEEEWEEECFNMFIDRNKRHLQGKQVSSQEKQASSSRLD